MTWPRPIRNPCQGEEAEGAARDGRRVHKREVSGKDGAPLGPPVVVYLPSNRLEESESVRLPASDATTKR
jgi:hypothetical protein